MVRRLSSNGHLLSKCISFLRTLIVLAERGETEINAGVERSKCATRQANTKAGPVYIAGESTINRKYFTCSYPHGMSAIKPYTKTLASPTWKMKSKGLLQDTSTNSQLITVTKSGN
jgi:hypothetical protein